MPKTKADWIGFLIYITFMVGLSISFLYFSWDQWQLSTDLESRGVSTQALIVKCNRDRGSHDITYEFEVEEGSQTGDMPATKQTYRNREYTSSRCNDVGTMIAIKYVPEDPTRSSSSEEYNRKWAKIFFYMSFFPPLIFVLMILGIYPGGPRSPGVPIKKLKAKLGRAVGTSTVDWLQLLLFMALLGGFCFLLLSYFKNSWQLHLTLEYRGVSTQALVVECRKTDDNYHITYEFEVDELDGIDNMPVTKQTYRFRERGGNAIWCQDLKGQTVSIKYLPEDPSRASSRAFRMVIGSCCFSFLLFVSFMLLFYKLIPRNIIKKIRKPVK